MSGRVFVEVITINGISVYAGTGDPNGALAAARGSLFSDKDTGNVYANTDGATTWELLNGGGAAGGARSTLVWRPAGPADPTNGVYMTWAAVHAAALAEEGPILIQFDSVGVPASITPAAAYDMDGISFQGVMDVEFAQNIIRIVEGVTFTNFSGNLENIQLEFLGTATPLFTHSTGLIHTLRTGRLSLWRNRGTVEMFSVTGGSILTVFVDDYSTLQGDSDGGGYEIFSVTAPSFVQVDLLAESTVSNDCVRGAGSFFTLQDAGGSSVSPLQTNFTGTLSTGGDFFYLPSDPAVWAGADPETTGQALDRLASAVETLLGAPVP